MLPACRRVRLRCRHRARPLRQLSMGFRASPAGMVAPPVRPWTLPHRLTAGAPFRPRVDRWLPRLRRAVTLRRSRCVPLARRFDHMPVCPRGGHRLLGLLRVLVRVEDVVPRDRQWSHSGLLQAAKTVAASLAAFCRVRGRGAAPGAAGGRDSGLRWRLECPIAACHAAIGPQDAECAACGAAAGQRRGLQAYISEPGVVSSSPVSSHVLRPDRIIGQPP